MRLPRAGARLLGAPGPLPLAQRWRRAQRADRMAAGERIRTLLLTLGRTPPAGDGAATLLAAVEDALADAPRDVVWLALAVLGARLPDRGDVVRTQRAARLDGVLAAYDRACLGPLLAGDGVSGTAGAPMRVRVVTQTVLVDVHDTARALFHTGIQRVARETTSRWAQWHPVLLVGWEPSVPALRGLTSSERLRALQGGGPENSPPAVDEVLVPWRSRYLLPELIADVERLGALQSLLRDSGNASGVVGFDCVPLTTAETVGGWQMSDGFAANLAAVAHADTVAPISRGSAGEYGGWRTMLAGAGLGGPEIHPVVLPAEVRPVPADVLEQVRQRYQVGALPMVLVVGSHEPRKNHLVVLHAAELLWREGVPFSLVFLGGNAWRSDDFGVRLRELAAVGRPVHAVLGVPDEELWAAYRAARCTVFPSLNEGFGLPLAESLAAGTPAVTSGFGSMQEIAADGGALLVDPRDPRDVATALRRLVTDDVLHETLAAQARARPVRTWDDYATELWDVLVEERQ